MEVGGDTSKEKAVFSAVLPVLGRGRTVSRMCRSCLSALLSVMTLTGAPNCLERFLSSHWQNNEVGFS